MKFGVIPAYQVAPVERGEYAAGFARLAEELGFESLWPVEHVVMPASYSSRYPYHPSGRMPIPDAAIPDPLIWNTWAAAATRRIRLATGMVILPQHNPVVFAKTVASLDALSGGRVLLGVGVGWLQEEADAVGTRFDDRGRRMDESIEAMRALWTQPEASYRGEHVRFEAVKCSPRPAQPGGVPVHIGGHSPVAARRAGRLGDGFAPLTGGTDQLQQLLAIMADAARDAGRSADQIEITCSGAPDLDSAKAFADVGVDRMIVASREPDLEQAKRVLGAFSEHVIANLGEAP